MVVIGASARGVPALTDAAASLPRELPYAVLIALHMPPTTPSVLARIMDRSGPLPARAAVHHGVLEKGHVYVAVPDHHLMVLDHRTVVSEGAQHKNDGQLARAKRLRCSSSAARFTPHPTGRGRYGRAAVVPAHR